MVLGIVQSDKGTSSSLGVRGSHQQINEIQADSGMGRFNIGLFAFGVIFTVSFVLEGLAVEPVGHDVLDLLHGLNTTSADSLSGLRFTTGPNNSTPALLLEDSDRRIALSRALTQRALRLLQDPTEVTFLSSVRQEVGNTGTLLAFASDTNRFLEIESNGHRNELRFHYTHNSQVQLETFPYRLADGKWHKLAVSLAGDQISVFVDCNRIYQRVIPTSDRTASGPLTLYIGQRNGQLALFRGALQDVKIVTQSHGYLLQCSPQDTECATCGKFQDLEQRVKEMSLMYTELKQKLMKAEERLSGLEQCECLKYCHVNGTQRQDGETWKKDTCNRCMCKNGTVECVHEECPKLDCTNPITVDGECCPVCPTTCLYSGKYYNDGETVSPSFCVTCTCVNGGMQCKKQDVSKECPVLNCPKYKIVQVHTECCPICNDTDHCAGGHTCHANARCVSMLKNYECECRPGFEGDGRNCEDINECKANGGRAGHHCHAGSTVCVNTPGSYRCECLPGYTRVDQNECKESESCKHGSVTCHHDAECLDFNGNYACACKDGYAGDGYTCRPKCSGECRNGGKCVAPNVCECRHGYIGPNCELDIDECTLGISKCHVNSVCINMPGWYHCDCVEGYHSSWPDNHYGSLCLDVNECQGEGEGHTCHNTTQCVNTDGGYTCQCTARGNCKKSCVFEGSEYNDRSTWKSVRDICKQCRCNSGRTSCQQMQCDCTDPNVNLQCCPSCNNNSSCPHQELRVLKQSGDSWLFNCQRCQCLNGEVTCWPLVCPKQSCENPIRQAGDCCPVCADHNPCAVWNMETGGQDLSQLTCMYLGTKYSHGEQWSLKEDTCTTCLCKV
ncbi:protein kinase C-binding protein NELL1-like [Physella acuta]|uniref:protein kinase C-binding protein NELL1-like n=1 Tax=Physella acuta TaxID=109671 RepID=UPI0027DE6185|nr:protein kinase C-binding protein NELL1-like [Physella acuta]